MRLTANPQEWRIIRAAVAFANVREIRSISQVNRLFQRHLEVAQFGLARNAPGGLAGYRTDQARLKAWLSAVASGEAAHRARVWNEAAQQVPVKARYEPRFLPGFHFQIVGVAGLEGICALAVAFILDAERGLTNRLGQCGDPDCGRFWLEPAGRPRRHCSEEHRRNWWKKTQAKEYMRDYRKPSRGK